MKARAAYIGLVAWLLCTTAVADTVAPGRLIVGGHELSLAGQGERRKWFVRLYDVGFYIPHGRPIAAAAVDITIPKAFRIQITYGGKPPAEIPRRWKEHLLPPLDPSQAFALHAMYSRLQAGDVVMVDYLPGEGTQLSRNGQRVLATPEHRFMSAFVALFLGERPVSESLRAELLGG